VGLGGVGGVGCVGGGVGVFYDVLVGWWGVRCVGRVVGGKMCW